VPLSNSKTPAGFRPLRQRILTELLMPPSTLRSAVPEALLLASLGVVVPSPETLARGARADVEGFSSGILRDPIEEIAEVEEVLITPVPQEEGARGIDLRVVQHPRLPLENYVWLTGQHDHVGF